MNWNERARQFLQALEARTGFRFLQDNARDGVEAFQRIAGLKVDGKAGDATFGKLRALFPSKHDDPAEPADPFAGWVNCLGVYVWGGVEHKPIISSGFVDDDGNGPNKIRWRTAKRRGDKYPGHLGVDMLNLWDGQSAPPPTLFDGRFFCEPQPVYAMGPGEVVYAKLLDIHPQYGGPRWAVKIYHGYLEGFGHCVTWSVHHDAVHVSRGQTVDAGDVIATTGDTGAEGAPHVHQEIWQWDEGQYVTRRQAPVNPEPIIDRLPVLAA